MSDELSGQELAIARYKEGYNCAEAILRAFRDELKLELSDEALKIATGFGGGLGHAGCMCGALTGAVMVLNLLTGRNSSAESRDPAYSSARDFHQIFSDHFGGTCCRVLNPYSFGTSDQRRNCLKVIGETADLLMKFIEAKRLARTQHAGK